MDVRDWVKQLVVKGAEDAREQGWDELLVARALLSVIVEHNKALRHADDLAHELQFLAENLDDKRDYMFMRP